MKLVWLLVAVSTFAAGIPPKLPASTTESTAIAQSELSSADLNSATTRRIAMQSGTTFYENFITHNSQRWNKIQGFNPVPFDYTGWKPEQVCIGNGLTLTLRGCRFGSENCREPGVLRPRSYMSGEYQSISKTFHYGQYRVRMKAAKGSGLVTGFFIMYREQTPQGVEHDEIDIEILGRDTTKVQLNYYSNKDLPGGGPLCDPDPDNNPSTPPPPHNQNCGQPSRSLGFDVADGYHEFLVDWQSTYIRWWYYRPTPLLVEPWRMLLEVNGKGDNEPKAGLPDKAGLIIFNLWARCHKTWPGLCAFKPPVSAYFDSVTYSNAGLNYNPNSPRLDGPQAIPFEGRALNHGHSSMKSSHNRPGDH